MLLPETYRPTGKFPDCSASVLAFSVPAFFSFKSFLGLRLPSVFVRLQFLSAVGSGSSASVLLQVALIFVHFLIRTVKHFGNSPFPFRVVFRDPGCQYRAVSQSLILQDLPV